MDMSALEPGSDLGPRYHIESLLGQGAMGLTIGSIPSARAKLAEVKAAHFIHSRRRVCNLLQFS